MGRSSMSPSSGLMLKSDDSELDVAAAIEAIQAAVESVTIGTGGHTILRAAISASSSGDNTLVAAVASKKIKVLSMTLIVTGDVDIRFESGAGGPALSGVMSLAADGNGFVLPPALPGFHHIETAAGELLNLELSGAVQVSGFMTYYTEA